MKIVSQPDKIIKFLYCIHFLNELLHNKYIINIYLFCEVYCGQLKQMGEKNSNIDPNTTSTKKKVKYINKKRQYQIFEIMLSTNSFNFFETLFFVFEYLSVR